MAQKELSKLKKRRGAVKASLTRFKAFLENYSAERDHSVLKIRFEKAKSLLSEFEDVHLEIEVIEDKGDEGARQLFEDCYYEYIAKAQELLDSEERSAAVNRNEAGNTDMRAVLTQLSNLNTNEVSVKLPTITLPKFEGKYEEWLSFEDSFRALVHDNVKIQVVQKFNYLKSCLVGNAAQIIQSLTSTAENYEIA
ncbi:hypothetical protein X777_01848 [Ooceraea biroi]|uniref:Uncharacterized protein n=1 Tax=Ooceraea biroi TaxID=2015173 RepID=A0A026X3Z3_OOCBI|nr:hypothetical protein X777_01848 [Ooceraea biroi]